MRLPLFPLNTVLFPGMVLPLHIFEERYKLLVQRCIADNAPFGVVLIREGQEVGGVATPHPVGTLAKITHVEPLPGGRMNIETTGTGRFRIRRLLDQEPYLAAEVETYPLAASTATTTLALVARLRPRIAAYLQLLSDDTTTQIGPEDMPDDPVDLAYLIAIALQVPMTDKQDLLMVGSARDLLVREQQLLLREHGLLRFMVSTSDAQQALVAGPTGQLFLN
jgi:Lon protease-like protein